MTKRPHVAVVGGGLAGLSSAIALVDAGAEVSLFEGRPRFGGATWSFERNGLQFDNGQHVYLRCCTAYRRFLERLGTAGDAPLQDRLEVPVLAPGHGGQAAKVAWIRRNRLPVPLHLAPSLLTYSHLSWRDRLATGRAVRALMRLRLTDPGIDAETFASFLERHGQSSRALQALFEVIALPTTNVHSTEGSLALAAKVFKTGLLGDPDAADIGWARVPLNALHVEPARALLVRSGAAVRARTKIDAVEVEPGRRTVVGVVAGGEHLAADAVILAVPHDAAAELLPQGSTVDPAVLHQLGHSPIIDVHLVYDRKVMPYELAAAIDSPVQFVFDRTAAAGLDEGTGQCLAISVSGADDEHGERPDVLIERFSAAIGELFPAARNATILDAVVSREHEATFRGIPGTAALRPGSTTGFENLFLAGAWTNTGWPATMEGAVRSGMSAASLALASVGSGRAGTVAERAFA